MEKTEKTGRNDPCPCGSGRKYKHCCEGKAAERKSSLTNWIAIALGVLVLLAVAGSIASLFRDDPGDGSTGRVWSAEHGHWHDVGGGEPRSTGRSQPRPPGPAPAGKVWAPHHGHWHDAP